MALTSSHAGDLTVNVAARGGSLKKAGLGSLFGASAVAGGTQKYYLSNSILFVAQSQGRIGENGSNPYSTEAVAPVIRGTGTKMMCRFGDLCYGWPYAWPGLGSWLAQVTNATFAIKSNYLDVTYAVAIFNEPDTQLVGSDFMTGPLIGGGSNHDARINWVWTKTFQTIRTLAPTVKIMGPNYFDYRPQADANHQTRMSNFLTNAIATGTVPDIIGWHSLVNGNPADVTTALNIYYRPLETSLGVSGAPLPVSIEEYGINNGAFEGIPGQMVRYWSEFERAGVDFACMGIYENGGSIGNTMRHEWDTNALPNAGWHTMNWYRQMRGEYIPVTHSTFDGVATWDSTNQTLTVVCGGADESANVQINGVGTLGIGTNVRVRLDAALWTTNANVANSIPNQGGDPQFTTHNIFDRNFALDASGNIAVPLRRLEGIYNGYRILISPSNSPASYPTKFEAEDATYNHVALHNGADGKYQSSGGAYIGGIDFADSFVCFRVPAPSNGLYNVLIHYAAGLGAASHFITVNGQSQGVVNYPGTTGWANSELRTVSQLVSLVQGTNHIMLTRATNFVELDFIDVRPDVHRYQAKLAVTNHVNFGQYANMFMVPDFVGGIDFADGFPSKWAIDAARFMHSLSRSSPQAVSKPRLLRGGIQLLSVQ